MHNFDCQRTGAKSSTSAEPLPCTEHILANTVRVHCRQVTLMQPESSFVCCYSKHSSEHYQARNVEMQISFRNCTLSKGKNFA